MDKALVIPKNLNFDKRLLAKFLYWMGWRISSIADYIDEPDKNVHAWKTRDEWDKDAPAGRVGEALPAQLIKLIILEKKTPGDYKEIDLLMRIRSYNPIWLTPREKELLKYIVEGLTNHEIAEKMYLGVETINSYGKNLLIKLCAKNTAILVRMALEEKLV